MLEIDNLSFTYVEECVIKNVSLSLGAGEIGCLIGPSGAGKTTLFKLIAGLLSPQKGILSIGGNAHPSRSSQISFLMQEDTLLPWRTAVQNVALSGELGTSRPPASSFKSTAKNLLEEMGLKGYEDYYPDELSAGMKLRVSLARALLYQRPLLLLDEPFGPLDAALREQIYHTLKSIRAKYGTTILIISHDFQDALSLADKIFLLKSGKVNEHWHVTDDDRKNPSATGKLFEELREAIKKN